MKITATTWRPAGAKNCYKWTTAAGDILDADFVEKIDISGDAIEIIDTLYYLVDISGYQPEKTPTGFYIPLKRNKKATRATVSALLYEIITEYEQKHPKT